MRRKWLTALLSVVVLAGVAGVAGCSGGGSDGAVSLSLGIWDKAQQPATQKLVDAFEKQHPKIHVKIQLTPWEQYWTKLQTAATGGSAPDAFWMNGPNFQLYAGNGVIAPLDKRIADDGLDTSVYPKALTDLYSYDAKPYALPKDFDTIGLWYNKELFDKAGVDYPDSSWTWKDVQAAAAKLTDPKKGVFGIAAPEIGQQNFYNTIFQAGGYVVSPDGRKSGFADPATIDGLKFWVDLIKSGSSPSYQQMVDTAPADLFQTGKVAMHYDGSWMAATFDKNTAVRDKIGVTVLPKGPKARASVIHGVGYAMYAKGKHQNETWQLIKFLGSERAATMLASSGTVIPAYQNTQQAWVDSMPRFHLKAFIDELAYAVPLPVSRNTAAWNADQDKVLGTVWTGKTSLADGARDLNDKVQAALDKENKD